MTPAEVKALLEAGRANSKKLDDCAGPHDLSVDLSGPAVILGKRWGCAKCGGEVDGIRKLWYERGLAHGRAERAVELAGALNEAADLAHALATERAARGEKSDG